MDKLTLELSFKSFKQRSLKNYRVVAQRLFEQWRPLSIKFKEVDVLLWISDGSEILEYQGRDDQSLEWGKYIGRANENETDWHADTDPQKLSPHATRYLYAETPADFVFGDIRDIIRVLKDEGMRQTGHPIRIGATFDPGPEFALSKFKYDWHPEISTGGAMGDKSFVVSYKCLHGDSRQYAAFPAGIPEGTPFATFLGAQSHRYLTEMGFDYIWFSNGFGFGSENWSTIGPLFDGETFDERPAQIAALKKETLTFWHRFRAVCPDFEVQTRGTNLSVGIDFATDAVATEDLYQGQLGLVPPPNSPWAALDKNYGLELAGYLSRIAELPNDHGYMYRYYLHDPWWANSPWFDRYEQFPHDIYLPLAMSRINHQGCVESPTLANFMTVDNSWGDLPEQGALVTQAHVLQALKDLPDQMAPITWLYPFHEYQNVRDGQYYLKKAFAEDWYMIAAINAGTPVSGVLSTQVFTDLTAAQRIAIEGTILITPVPFAGSAFEQAILSYVAQGGKVIFYGSLAHTSQQFQTQLGLITHQKTVKGTLQGNNQLAQHFAGERNVSKIKFDPVLSDDFGYATLENGQSALASVIVDGVAYGATMRTRYSNTYWLRGSNPHILVPGKNLLQPISPTEYFATGSQLRYTLDQLGYHIEYDRTQPNIQTPAMTIARHNNGFYFSVYTPNTSVETKMRFPLGVPIMMGDDTKIDKGYGYYHFDRSEHRECRLFVQQVQGIVSMSEYGPVSVIMKRRMQISGLEDATIYVFPEKERAAKCELLLNSEKPNISGEPFEYTLEHTEWGDCLVAKHVTGKVMCSFEFDQVNYLENGGANQCKQS